MMIDIDHFKKVNDNYGHKAGDHILSSTAQIIQKEIREDDIFIRFGGEEFLVFVKKTNKDLKLAYAIAQRIRTKIEISQFSFESKDIRITLSIGIACQPEQFKNTSLAIKHADKMLYVAKREGRNQVISHTDEDYNEVETHKKSINDVKAALEEDRVICFYQAIYSTKTDQVIKYEALVRIEEKDGSITLPFEFLETIMYTNIYNDLTQCVLNRVFKKIKKIKMDISVNLNFSDILDNKIFNLIIDELESNKEFSSWLVIELLEYELLEEISTIQKRLLQIKEYGVKIAIDDFGSGYSNYSIFKQLPIDILKIDGSLIKDIDHSDTSYKITSSIATLAQELGINTVAEFVHSKAVLQSVKKLPIDEVQGFYLAKPSPNIL
jgi:diguanylate cyclase (GGDEF)-like protein